MTQVQRRAVRGAAMVAGMVLATMLTGCQNFFVCDKASCTTNPTTPTGPAGDVAYVANNLSASTSMNGYTLGKTTLTAATGSPYAINNTPTALVLSHNNGFLYEASNETTASQAGIFGFTVGTGGALSVLNSGNAFAPLPVGYSVGAMDVSPDGNWLIVSSTYNTTLNAGATIQAYPLNATTGAITVTSSSPLPVNYRSQDGIPQVSALKVAPSGQFIAVALGTGGVSLFAFNTTTGLITLGTPIGFTPTGSAGGYDVAIDGNNLLYVAATSSIFVFQVSSAGASTKTVTNGIAIGSTGPWSIALDGTSYVYAGATGTTGGTSTNLIYGFSNNAGVLTALTPASSATIAAPSTTTKIAVDSTGAYLLADGYDTSAGLKLYSITAATGVLTSLDTAPTGVAASGSVNAPTALALSH